MLLTAIELVTKKRAKVGLIKIEIIVLAPVVLYAWHFFETFDNQ
jgi:hypothetical protein